MRKRILWVMTAILTICGTSMLNSCSEDDNPVIIDNPDDIIGWWYTEYKQDGTFPYGEGENDDYYKVIEAACFNEDGTGLWTKLYVNTAEDLIFSEDERFASFAANFKYTIKPDGTISVNIVDLEPTTIANVKIPDWEMKFEKDHIFGYDGDIDYTMKEITTDEFDNLDNWLTQIIGGADTGDPDYNINNDQESAGAVFDRDNWHQQYYIVARVGSNANENIIDKYGRKGYQRIVLPWAKDASGNPATVVSNLPEFFCDDITPENGWDLVANFCGRYDFVNANYIALYNKWTGILRYFFYLPADTKLNNAQDHSWEILMGNGAAEHTPFRYALPLDKKMSAKDGEKISARNGGYWSQFTTPYTVTGNGFGQLEPKDGWYAFDVDLSVYRGDANTMKSDRFIKPLLRGYTQSNVNLYGNINADITGDIQLEKCCVNTQNGVFGPLEEVLENVKGVKDFIGNAAEVYKNVMEGDILGAIEGGINVAKQGCDLVGIDYGKTEEGFDGYKGSVNMKLTGTIDLKGTIKSSAVIQGPAQINQSISEFDFERTLLGEGVWNIETSPIVYYTNAQIQWRHEYRTFDGDLASSWWVNGKSPFGANKTQVWTSGYSGTYPTATTSKDPWCGYVNYFDPSNIKVVLNPNLFTAEEIASAQVYATCGVRKATSVFGSVDNYRAAFGLTGSKISIDKKNGGEYYNRPHDEAAFDALSSSENKMDMKTGTTFKATKYDGYNCGMFGRGDSEYILEPQPLSGDEHPLCTYMPSYEVTVTVIVNHNGKPIVYSRTYLPEYKKMDVADLPVITSDYIKQHKPDNYVEGIYAQQMNHIKDFYTWTRRTLQPKEGNSLTWRGNVAADGKGSDKLEESWPCLFDGKPNTKWCCHKFARVEYADGSKRIWADFNTNYGISPTGYTLTTADDNAVFHSRRPRVWYVHGKKNEGDNWVLLAEESTSTSAGSPTENALPHSSLTPVNYKFNKANPKDFRFFKFEIVDNWSSDDDSFIQLAEFQFTYDE